MRLLKVPKSMTQLYCWHPPWDDLAVQVGLHSLFGVGLVKYLQIFVLEIW